MQFYYLTQLVFLAIINLRIGAKNGEKMETLTLFIDHLYNQDLNTTNFQMIADRSFKSRNYKDLTLSGNRYTDVVFEDVIFENCTFFGSTLDNCLFINCLFINCNFQFSHFNNCNFEQTSWENCKWGVTALKDTKTEQSEWMNNLAFESTGAGFPTKTLTMNEFLNLCSK